MNARQPRCVPAAMEHRAQILAAVEAHLRIHNVTDRLGAGATVLADLLVKSGVRSETDAIHRLALLTGDLAEE